MTTSPNVHAVCRDGRVAPPDGRVSGRELLGAALGLARRTRDAIEEIPDVEVLDDELLGAEASHDLDRLQILMDVSATGCSRLPGRRLAA